MHNESPGTIASVVHDKTSLTVGWTDGQQSQFPLRWLRYECTCELCGESSTGIRFVTLPNLARDLSVSECSVNASGAVAVTWLPDAHRSCYAPAWLRRHCLEPASRARRLHKPATWGCELLDRLPRVSFQGFANDPERRYDAYAAIREIGLVHIIEGPTEPGTVERLARIIGPLEETNFGKVFDLKSDPNAKAIGATRHPAPLHTDDPYRNMPTGIKVLHCIRDSDPGTGYSLFADGFHLAKQLEQSSPKVYELLCSVPITFHRRYQDAIITAVARVFSFDHAGRISGFRFQDRSMAPLDLAGEEVDEMLDAIIALMSLIEEPRHQLKLRLQPGEAVIFDNHRLLHGRTGFSGPRHLQLCSVNRDTFISELRVLERNLGRDDASLSFARGALS